MVEVAFVLPIFFLMVFAIVQLSIVFFGYSNAVYASQVGLRYAVVHGGDSASPCTAATVVTLVTKNIWAAPSGGTSVTVAWSPTNYTGSIVSIKVSLTFPTGIPFSALSSVQVGTYTSGTVLY